MSEVCNSCGSPKVERPCAHCSMLVCKSCRVNHESICVEMQKKIRRGEGPTIRNIASKPVTTPVAPLPDMGAYRAELQAVEDACKSPDKGKPTHSHDESCFVEPVVYTEDAQRDSEIQFASEVYDDRDDSPYNPESEYEDFEYEHGGEA